MSNFQAASSQQGKQWEEVVEFCLLRAGWTVTERNVRRYGIEIDLVAFNRDGVEHWIEAKGSHRGKVPGMLRHDTVRKALFSGYHLTGAFPERPPYWIITSHLPQSGAMVEWIDAALAAGVIDRVITEDQIEVAA